MTFPACRRHPCEMNSSAHEHESRAADPGGPTSAARHRVNVLDVDLTGRTTDARTRIQLSHGAGGRIGFLEFFTVSTNDIVWIAADLMGKRSEKSARIEATRQCVHIAAFDRL